MCGGDGASPNEPLLQVHALDEHTFVLRQSLRTDAEAPFVFLLFGDTGALLIDSGATADVSVWPLRPTIDEHVGQWLTRYPRASYRLTVAHTHGHGDHILGDAQFSGSADVDAVPPKVLEVSTDGPKTPAHTEVVSAVPADTEVVSAVPISIKVVPADVDGVRRFFGFDRWPDETVTFDLGGRAINVIGGPGHEAAATVFYDPWTGILFTGDTVYPGRLYVEDMPQYRAIIGRLVSFAQTVSVTHLLGCHIEMSATPGRDYPLGARQHPNEAPLPMLPGQLDLLYERVQNIADRPGVHRFDDVVAYNGSEVVDAYFASISAKPSDLVY